MKNILLIICGAILWIMLSQSTRLILSSFKRKKATGKRRQANSDTPKPIGTMNLVLLVLGVFLLAFIVTMIVIFVRQGQIPDTLVQCVFGACGIEGGIMGWIKTTKERRQDRRWKREDQKNGISDQ